MQVHSGAKSEDWLETYYAMTSDPEAWASVTAEQPIRRPLNLHLLGLRYYAPPLARFMSLDPIRSGRNWFRYPAAPTTLTDPMGLYVDDRERIAGLEEFLRAAEGQTEGRRYMYTCKCGWLDSAHLRTTKRGAEIMWFTYMRDSAAFEMAMYQFTAKQEMVKLKGRPVYAKVGFYTRPRVEGLPKSATTTWRRIAAFVSYAVNWEVEKLQGVAHHPSGWSYEDLPSDFIGALAGTGEYDLRQLLKSCAPVGAADALCLYDEMTAACGTGGPCHETDARELRVPFPKNPIWQARLFHQFWPSTRGMCPLGKDIAPPSHWPMDLSTDWEIDQYIGVPAWETLFAHEFDIGKSE